MGESLLFEIARGASVGVIIGLIIRIVRSKNYAKTTEKRRTEMQRTSVFFAKGLKYLTFTSLCLGLIWTMYYLVLGVLFPEQTEHATNVSQLIVSVLTVISIIFAFYEFLREK